MSATGRVLMCAPDHYRIAYEINPWMRRSNPVEDARAREQWHGLHRALLGLGVEVELAPQGEDAPDMVFTANAGIVAGGRFVAANFRHPERRPEQPRFQRWFEDRGYAVAEIDGGLPWEGEGDVLEIDGQVFAATGPRTDAAALDRLDEVLGVRAVRLALVDPRYYHLDTCFFPISRGLAMYYPPAFAPESRAVIEQCFDDLIEVPAPEAERFACNALLVRGSGLGTVVLNTDCPTAEAELEVRGYRCAATPTAEFIKAGGSVKCLTLTLDNFRS